VIDAALEAHPASAAAEYTAEFRTDVETFVSRDVVEAAIIQGRFELQPAEGARLSRLLRSITRLKRFHDAGDHANAGHRVIVDAFREVRSPFSPDSVVKEFAATLKSFLC
jgi:hypothetical protein